LLSNVRSDMAHRALRAAFSRAWSCASHRDIQTKVALGDAGSDERVAPGSPTDQYANCWRRQTMWDRYCGKALCP
jgi:hypothetical protein